MINDFSSLLAPLLPLTFEKKNHDVEIRQPPISAVLRKQAGKFSVS
jgi:hypothetical protein